MPILNGFLRGAHDEEITANIDQKQYQGVPVNTYNWIGTKRGGLSKRAPFKLQRKLDQESYLIPYSYDDDEKYLLRFYKNDSGETKCDKILYKNGSLIGGQSIGSTSFGGVEYEQPTFTSNTSNNHAISSSTATIGANAYKAFNADSLVSSSTTNVWLSIEFPEPVLLSTISYTYGQTSSNQSSGAFKTTELEITDEQDTVIQIGTINNTFVMEGIFPTGGSQKFTKDTTSINPQSLFAKKLKIKFTDYWYNHNGSSVAPNIGNIKITGQVLRSNEEETIPFTYEQIKTANYYNSYRKMYFVHKDFKPCELALTFTTPKYTYGNTTLDEQFGNPTLVRVFQQRLVFAGFTKYPRQINASKSIEYNTFTLNKTDTVSTDPIEGAIDEMKSPLTALFSGRQMLYAQSMDGLGSLNSGADDVPLTATQVTARLRNETPLSKHIQPIRQDEIVYCVGADDKTVYALDYDYQYARIPLYQLNEHCISYFNSGIKQMASMKGKLPYIVFLLNDGSLIFAIAYRSNTGFQFHAFPQKLSDGAMLNMAVLRNTQTGFDTLFGVVEHSNGQYSIESIESYTDFYTDETGQEYFKNHILLDMKQEKPLAFNTDVTFTYTGTTGDNGKREFVVSAPVNLPDSQIKLLIEDKEIDCLECVFDENGNMWAYTSTEPIIADSTGYLIPKRTFNMPEYIGLPVQAFDGEDFIEKESENGLDRTITFKKPIYSAKFGLPYTAYSEFINIVDVNSAPYETIINSISACITYGTGIKLGTETALEKVGYSEYPYTQWQDKILPDESLKNVILNDRGVKNKRIVLECDFPFPANVTFITYDIKATGVK